MSTFAIVSLATSRGRADRIIFDLKAVGFAPTDVGILFFDRVAENPLIRDPRGLPASDAAAQSAGSIRGVFGWIAGIGRLVVPGVGTFVAAGPILTALQQARNSAPGVAISRGLIGLGIPAAQAARFEQRIKTSGHILLSVHTSNPNRILRVREILDASTGGGNLRRHRPRSNAGQLSRNHAVENPLRM
jgi:hypothetical protein